MCVCVCWCRGFVMGSDINDFSLLVMRANIMLALTGTYKVGGRYVPADIFLEYARMPVFHSFMQLVMYTKRGVQIEYKNISLEEECKFGRGLASGLVFCG